MRSSRDVRELPIERDSAKSPTNSTCHWVKSEGCCYSNTRDMWSTLKRDFLLLWKWKLNEILCAKVSLWKGWQYETGNLWSIWHILHLYPIMWLPNVWYDIHYLPQKQQRAMRPVYHVSITQIREYMTLDSIQFMHTACYRQSLLLSQKITVESGLSSIN